MIEDRIIIRGDTDSVFVHIGELMEEAGLDPEDSDLAYEYAEKIQKGIADKIPERLSKRFLAPVNNTKILEPGLDFLAKNGLYLSKKKRYFMLLSHDGGHKVDKLKISGIEIKRSDTPKVIQDFLKDVLEMIVRSNSGMDDVLLYIMEFRRKFRTMRPVDIGFPGKANNLDKAERQMGTVGGVHHVAKACVITNKLAEKHGMPRMINDGDPVAVVSLIDKATGIPAIAIPRELAETDYPDWMKDMLAHVDIDSIEQKMVVKKLENILSEILDIRLDEFSEYAEFDDTW